MRKLGLVLGLVGTTIALCVGCSKEEKKSEESKKVDKVVESTSSPNEEKFDANLQEYRNDKMGEEVQVAEVDLDMDGKKDKIFLKPTEDKEMEGATILDIKVNDATHRQDYGFYDTAIYTLQIDDNTVLLALYDSGLSSIPTTLFYKYSNGKIEEVGAISQDVRLINDTDSKNQVVIEKGVIKWKEHIGIIGVNPIIQTKWDGKKLTTVWDGEFNVETEQESYKVKKDIKVMTDYNDENSKVVIKANQNIKITNVFSRLEKLETESYREFYLYFEAEDGTKGWTTTANFTEEDIEGIQFAG